MALRRGEALYKQLAAEIRKGMVSGEYPAGSLLPSETALIERYGVSRPTVRNAIAALRAQGLIEVVHGKGSYVRGVPAGPKATLNRDVIQASTQQHDTPADAWWRPGEEVTVHRGEADQATAALLGIEEGEAVFTVECAATDPETGVKVMYRRVLPFAVADGTALAEAPDAEPGRAYSALAAAHGSLSWRDTISARMPLPDEAAALDTPEATPVLHATRITQTADGRPLILEETRTSAAAAALTYSVTAKAPAEQSRATAAG
ncbi:GntR family transcriptional regulator [Streptomyces capparidis]